MARQWKRIPLEEARTHPLYGIKGWLLFFVVTSVIGWLFGIAEINAAAIREGLTLTQLLSINAPGVSFIKFALFFDFLVLLSVLVCTFTKSRDFRKIISGVMLVIFPFVAFVGLSMQLPAEIGNELAKGFFRWLMMCAIWVTYLQRSVRVRVTFENSIPDDESIIKSQPLISSPILAAIREPTSTMSPSIEATLRPQAIPLAAESKPQVQTVQAEISQPKTEEDFWAAAMSELDNGTRRPGLWAKAFAESDGDETKAKVAYLKSRVLQLTEMSQANAAERDNQRKMSAAKEQEAAMELRRSVEKIAASFIASGRISIDEIKMLARNLDIEKLIKLKTPISGNTLLHECAANEMVEEVHALLQAGADPQISNNNGLRPEFLSKHPAIKKLLTSPPVSAEELEYFLRPPVGLCPNCGDVVPSSAHTCSNCRAMFGPLSTYKILELGRDEAIVKVKSDYMTAKNPTENQIKFLVRVAPLDGSLVAVANDSNNETLLHWCASFGLAEEAALLLAHGANAKAKTLKAQMPHELCDDAKLRDLLLAAAK